MASIHSETDEIAFQIDTKVLSTNFDWKICFSFFTEMTYTNLGRITLGIHMKQTIETNWLSAAVFCAIAALSVFANASSFIQSAEIHTQESAEVEIGEELFACHQRSRRSEATDLKSHYSPRPNRRHADSPQGPQIAVPTERSAMNGIGAYLIV